VRALILVLAGEWSCSETFPAPLVPDIPLSNRVGSAEDRVVDPYVVAQVGHVVAFALAVGVVLHAVERQVVQAHLIVAVAHQHLGDGARHELRDGGGCRQLRGDCGGQQGKRAGGEGVEVFAVDLGVEHMAVEGRGGFVTGAQEAVHLELACAPIAVFENVQPIYAEGEDLVDGRQFGLGKRWVPTARRRPARRSGPTWGGICGDIPCTWAHFVPVASR